MKRLDISDSNLKEFLDHASETNITPTVEAYKDWAINVKGLGKQFDFAKVKAIALNTAMNAALSIGISLVIQGITYALKEWVFNIEAVKEKAEEALSAYKSTTDTLKSHKKTIEEISDDYARLSRGVDNLGRNVSLNTIEQERYHEITNKIADMFPEMVKGYDAEGNAIIKHKGNVDALTEAYEPQAQAAKDALLLQSNDISPTCIQYRGELPNVISDESLYSDELCRDRAQYELLAFTRGTNTVNISTPFLPIFDVTDLGAIELPLGTVRSEQIIGNIDDLEDGETIINKLVKISSAVPTGGMWHKGTDLTHTTNTKRTLDIGAKAGDFYLNTEHYYIYVTFNGDEWTYMKSIAITTPPNQTEFISGTDLDLSGMVVTGYYNDGTSEVITDYTVSGYDSSRNGKQTLTIEYNGLTTTLDITVSPVRLTGIRIASLPDKLYYCNEETSLDLTGLIVDAVYNNGTSKVVTNYTVSDFNGSKAGNQDIIVTYSGYVAKFTVTVKVYEYKVDSEISKNYDFDTQTLIVGTTVTSRTDAGAVKVIVAVYSESGALMKSVIKDVFFDTNEQKQLDVALNDVTYPFGKVKVFVWGYDLEKMIPMSVGI